MLRLAALRTLSIPCGLRSPHTWRLLSTKNDTIRLQLDYFMSSQFAGVAVAIQEQLYDKAGLMVEILPDVEPGLEPQSVLAAQAENPDAVCVGSIEQNVLFPSVVEQGADVTAVAAMFGRSPLGLAALPSAADAVRDGIAAGGEGLVIGTHVDTVALVQRVLPRATVHAVLRTEKLSKLLSEELHAVQVYDVMETASLEAKLGMRCAFTPLWNCAPSPIDLGYCQVLFTPTNILKDLDRKQRLQRFLQATFSGWEMAIQNPRHAAKAVMALQPQDIDHWVPELDFTTTTVERCNDYVKMSRMGQRLGVIDPTAWQLANKWLAHGTKGTIPSPDQYPKLDDTVWGIDKRLMVGDGLARQMISATQQKAGEVQAKLGRRASLAVITVGEEPIGATHQDALRRIEIYAPKNQSWFAKTVMGNALGVAVEEVNMPATASTEEVVAEILRHGKKDGIQLMWPLPSHIDSVAAYSAIRPDQDVDGAFYITKWELAGGQAAAKKAPEQLLQNAPVTPCAVLKLLDHYQVSVEAKRAVVIGRSRIVGQPLAYMLGARGAIVTILHRGIPSSTFSAICKEADILIACAGQPGLVTPDMVKEGAIVVNVGSTFVNDQLQMDIPHDINNLPQAQLVASGPGGVGPLSAAVLFDQVVDSALKKVRMTTGDINASVASLPQEDITTWLTTHPTWTLGVSPKGAKQALHGDFHFSTFSQALHFIAALGASANEAWHHPNLHLHHQCVEGTTVSVEWFTLSTGTVTALDIQSALTTEACYNTVLSAATP